MVKKNLKTATYIIVGISLLFLISLLVRSLTNNIDVEATTEKLGIWGPLFIIFGIVFGGIFVPISSLPFILAGLTLYGFWETFLYYYIGNNLIAPVIGYWVASKYGRGVVVKLAGKKALKQIDKIASVVGIKVLFILRLLGGVLYELASYSAGLANFDFRKYLLFTLTLPIPGMILNVYFVERGLFGNYVFLLAIVIWWYASGMFASWLIYKEAKKK